MTMKKAVIANNRFGLGAAPGDLARVAERPTAWLLDQLQGPHRSPPEIARLNNSATVLVEVQDLRRSQREMQRSGKEIDPVEKYGRIARGHYLEQTAARYRTAIMSKTPFHERLVHFWSNHFAISADKQPLPAIAGLFENEAIRPHVTGKFADLLLAAEQHPAMILYLDNQRSIGPNSKLAQRATRRQNRRQNQREFGLNENLAREILELHTLGVDGGYSQQDVTTFAKVITGWSIGGANERGRFADGEPGKFEFRETIHEPGGQTLLGKKYAAAGIRAGRSGICETLPCIRRPHAFWRPSSHDTLLLMSRRRHWCNALPMRISTATAICQLFTKRCLQPKNPG